MFLMPFNRQDMPLDKTSPFTQSLPFIFVFKHDTNEVQGENKPADDNGYSHVPVIGIGDCDTGCYFIR